MDAWISAALPTKRVELEALLSLLFSFFSQPFFEHCSCSPQLPTALVLVMFLARRL